MGTINVVLSTLTHEKEYMDKLREVFAPAEFIQLDASDAAGISAVLERADVALLRGDLDERYVKAPKLKWVHCDHAGLNKSARPDVFEKGLNVTSSAGRSGPALAEHCMFFMLTLAYNFPAFYEAQKRHQYGKVEGMGELKALYGRTVGILGMGHTGRELAIRAKAFNMRVLGYRRRYTELPEGVDKLYCKDKGDSIDELLKESDFIAIALPLSDATYNLIGEHELGMMKPNAIIINLGRGSIIDEDALVKALKAGRIAGAGLDTVSKEPLPPDSPLWDCPRLLITPHFTPPVPDKTDRAINVICENARRFRAGEPMLNLLTSEDVYTR